MRNPKTWSYFLGIQLLDNRLLSAGHPTKIDHLFQRRQANLEQISNRFSEDLVHLKDISQLVERIQETITQALYPQRIDIFIYKRG